MKNEFTCHSIAQLPQAARWLAGQIGTHTKIAFTGHMAAGKTTLIAALCQHLGVKHEVSSPTYSLANEYRGSQGTIWHFDFYRLKNEQEALDMGLLEYLDSGHLCLMEWPEKIASLLAGEELMTVALTVLPDGGRQIAVV